MQGSYYSWPERGKMFTKVIQLLNTAIEQNITFSNHISNKIQEDTAFEWTQKGLLRFYYSEMFNTKSRTLESLNGLLPQLLYSTLTYRSRVRLQFVIIDHRQFEKLLPTQTWDLKYGELLKKDQKCLFCIKCLSHLVLCNFRAD